MGHAIANTQDMSLVYEKRDPQAMATTEVKNGVHIIHFNGHSGLTKKWNWFWLIFEMTIARLLSIIIERKSIKIIKKYLRSRGDSSLDNPLEKARVLAKARQNFGNKKISELFKLRTIVFNSYSPLLQHFCENVANAPALDDVYNVLGTFSWDGKPIYPQSAKPDRWSRLYLDCPNGQAIRNRYLQVKNIYKKLGGGKTLSIACGSAQPLIHAIRELKDDGKDNDTKVILTDVNPKSLGLARKIAIEAGVSDKIICREASFLELPRLFVEEEFDIVEACGILDYLPDKHAIKLLKFSLKVLKPNGRIIVSNIAPTFSAESLRKMYNWELNYRTPQQFGNLIVTAGGKLTTIYVEPWGIHCVGTAMK